MKKVFVSITITLCLVIGLQGFYIYRQHSEIQTLTIEHVRLQADYAALQEEYRSLEERHASLESNYGKLQADYASLDKQYGTLEIKYSTLSDKFTKLEGDYASLKSDFSALSEKYQKLFSDYQLLKEALFDRPLEYKVVPSVEFLQRWLLYEDQTETIEYDDPDFVCGDFAAMLAIHARVKHWDMGVVGIWGYIKDTREDYAHALNAIITTEGLVYVEPQTDDVWWYRNREEISIGKIYEMENQLVYVEDVRIILAY